MNGLKKILGVIIKMTRNVLKNNLDDFAKFMNYINKWIKDKNY